VFFFDFEKEKNSVMTTNFKAVKGECNEIRKKDKALNDLLSKALSKVRQPVESLFNLLTEKKHSKNM